MSVPRYHAVTFGLRIPHLFSPSHLFTFVMKVHGVLLTVLLLSARPVLADLSAEPSGFFSEAVGLDVQFSDEEFNCSNVTLFLPSLSDLPIDVAVNPINSTFSCHNISLGPGTNVGDCKWVPQTFLGIMYDRGVEMMRHNIPQRDAFQVYVSNGTQSSMNP
jgi:hypothetical protein